MHHNNQPLFKEDEKRRRVTASPFERKRRKEDDADSNDIPVAGASSTAAAACYELLSSSSDDEENKKNGITVRKEKTVTGAQQHQQRTGEWLTSLNVRRDDDSSSSSDDDSDVTKAAMERREWLTSSTAHTKLDHLTKIESSANKALQMLLWEIGFDYNVLAHQFEAIRFVAGVVKTFPLAADQSGHGKDDIGSDSDTIDRKNDNDINEMLALDFAGEMRRFNALKQHTNLIKTRGALLADEMGLGKTIEALGGAALRNHLIGVKGKSKTKKPTLIVTPQDGIQQQWYDALRRAGVEPARICVVGERKKDTKARCGSTFKSSTTQEGMYLLCTRYKIQSELKKLFEQTANLNTSPQPSLASCETNTLQRSNWERRQDCITRLIRESFNDDKASFKTAFNSVIIDECHFLKNVIAYWGIGAALLGGQAKRTVLLSGTPYNNGPSDMSALMTFIDPRNKAAQLNWWGKAVGKGKKKDIAESVGHWRRSYMLRRQKDVLLELPARERKCVNIAPFPSELFIYENYEFAFLSALKKLQEAIDDGNPESIRKQKELCDIMMATMSCMRMALVHPLLPGGREITIQFSPSRRYLLKREENKEQCVLCSGRSYPTQRAEAFAARRAAEENGGEFIADEDYLNLVGADVRVRAEMDLDDDELDDEDVLSGSNTRVNMKKGQLVELNDNGICQAAGSDCRHFAHKKCLEVFLEHDGNQCPRCYDLRSRIHISNNDGVSTVSHRVCCSKTQTTVSDLNGFTASAKIVKTIEWFKTTVPDDEKAIILSFFKGSLDLVEGILSDELDIECARYDGDVGKDTRAADLKRFQTSSSCRVLLASVQSGGTGLNITQANHVCFLDRWFNPQVHDQAESRVHRIGQKKDVKISYLDTALTVDCVMKIVNEYKLDNASVLLADGTSLGDAPRGAVGYKDLSGVIGNSIKAIREMRRHVIALNEQTGDGGLPIALPFDADQLFNKVQEVINSRPVKAKPKKEDGDVSSHGYESGDNAMFEEDVDDTVKGKSMKWHASQESSSSNDSVLNYNLHAFVKAKPTKWPPSQESSSSNDSILNYDIHASVKNETKPTKLPPTQESSSSNDSILDYDIFSTKKPKTARSVNIGIDLERGSRRKDVIDLSLDDDGDDKHRATYAQTTLPLDPTYPR